MKLAVGGIVCASIFASCSTVSHNTGFDGTGNVSFPLIVAGEIEVRDGANNTFGFHRVDLSKSAFLADSFEITFGGGTSLGGSEFKKPDQLTTAFRFAGKSVNPGEYALVYKVDSNVLEKRIFIHVDCYSLGAVIYRLNAGQINILPIIDIRDKREKNRAAIESQVKLLMQAYPNMSAPLTFGDVVGSATFNSAPKTGNKKSCGSSGSFSLRPFNQVSR